MKYSDWKLIKFEGYAKPVMYDCMYEWYQWQEFKLFA